MVDVRKKPGLYTEEHTLGYALQVRSTAGDTPLAAATGSYTHARGFMTDTDGDLAFTDLEGNAITGFTVKASVIYPIGFTTMTSHSVGSGATVFLLY